MKRGITVLEVMVVVAMSALLIVVLAEGSIKRTVTRVLKDGGKNVTEIEAVLTDPDKLMACYKEIKRRSKVEREIDEPSGLLLDSGRW